MEEEGPAVLFPLLLGSLGKANQASWWMCLEFDVFTNTEQTKMAANTVVSFKEPHHRSHFGLTLLIGISNFLVNLNILNSNNQ